MGPQQKHRRQDMQRRPLLLAAAALLPAIALAQTPPDWPTRPVRMLVGSAPGGGTDAMARAVADRLAPLLRQPVIVENRPGVSNTLAGDMTAKSTDEIGRAACRRRG